MYGRYLTLHFVYPSSVPSDCMLKNPHSDNPNSQGLRLLTDQLNRETVNRADPDAVARVPGAAAASGNRLGRGDAAALAWLLLEEGAARG